MKHLYPSMVSVPFMLLFVTFACVSQETQDARKGYMDRERVLIESSASLSARMAALQGQFNGLSDNSTEQGAAIHRQIIENNEAAARVTAELASVRDSVIQYSRLAQEEKDRSAARAASIGGSLVGTALRATVGLPSSPPPPTTQPGEEGGFPWGMISGGLALLMTQLGRGKTGGTNA